MTVSPVRRYSESFKREVVSQIVSGKLTMNSARKRYNIGGGVTIPAWLRKYGHTDKLPKVDYIMTVSDMDRIKQLEKEKQALESALAQMHLRATYYESLVSAIEENYGIDVKKNEDICPTSGIPSLQKSP